MHALICNLLSFCTSNTDLMAGYNRFLLVFFSCYVPRFLHAAADVSCCVAGTAELS